MYTALDGDNLAVQDWPLPHGMVPRGVVLLLHGLGEHVGRYEHIARRLNHWGFSVRGYDQYGHGESGGVRGALPSPTRLLDDLADLVETTRAKLRPGVPLLLLGHSMGGLVAASFVAHQILPVDGLVLSSPALAVEIKPVQRAMMSVLPRLAPNLTVGNGLRPEFLSTNPAVVDAYKSDPRVHNRISARLAQFIAEEGPKVLARAPGWTVPTLLMYAGADRLVDPAGSRAFAAAAPPDHVTARCFEKLYHEIFNERDPTPVFLCLKDWLDERF